MKNLLSLILTLFTVISFNAQNKKYSELNEYKLRGKIKAITQYIYTDLIPKESVFIPKDSLKWKSKSIIYYNIKGNCDSIVNYTLNNGIEIKKYIIKYNYTRQERTGLLLINGNIVNKYHKYWIAPNEYKEDVIANEKVVTSSKFILSETNFIKEKIETPLDIDTKYEVQSLHYKYYFNEKNYLYKITLIKNNKENDDEIIQDLSFDKMENSIKSLKKNISNNTYSLVYRKIDYYD